MVNKNRENTIEVAKEYEYITHSGKGGGGLRPLLSDLGQNKSEIDERQL